MDGKLWHRAGSALYESAGEDDCCCEQEGWVRAFPCPGGGGIDDLYVYEPFVPDSYCVFIYLGECYEISPDNPKVFQEPPNVLPGAPSCDFDDCADCAEQPIDSCPTRQELIDGGYDITYAVTLGDVMLDFFTGFTDPGDPETACVCTVVINEDTGTAELDPADSGYQLMIDWGPSDLQQPCIGTGDTVQLSNIVCFVDNGVAYWGLTVTLAIELFCCTFCAPCVDSVWSIQFLLSKALTAGNIGPAGTYSIHDTTIDCDPDTNCCGFVNYEFPTLTVT